MLRQQATCLYISKPKGSLQDDDVSYVYFLAPELSDFCPSKWPWQKCPLPLESKGPATDTQEFLGDRLKLYIMS